MRDTSQRKAKPLDYLNEGGVNSNLTTKEHQQMLSFLKDHCDVFSLDDGDKGETDLVEMTNETGNAVPKEQAVHRTPFTVRHKVDVQLQKMLKQNIIQPSCSSWMSPFVLVQKKDGCLQFCEDDRSLNAVTKPDHFPLPRIDDMLDQLGNRSISQHWTWLLGTGRSR